MAVLLALLFSAFVVVGASFAATDSPVWFTSSVGAAIGSALAGLGVAAVFFIPIRTLYALLDRRWDRQPEPPAGVIPMREALRRWFLPTFGAVSASWLCWLC